MANHPNRTRKVATASLHDHDADYAALLIAVKSTFAAASRSPLFVTDAAGLNEAYLKNVGDERGIHDCSACRRFIESFGRLVTIADDGHLASAMWDVEAVPEFYQPAIAVMIKTVERARVEGPFLSPDRTWACPKTGTWTHFSVPSPGVYKHALTTAGQAMAAKREDFNTVARALADFAPSLIAEAIRVLETGHLASSEKFITPLNWLADLHAKRSEAKDARIRANLLWRAIATAPAGYCHPRAAVTGTLLEDIAAGLPFDDVKARFNAKVAPLAYQRPQAAPSAGNIAEGEKIIEKMGLARSLERRFARLDECQTAWLPTTPKAPSRPAGGVFAHLTPKGAAVQAAALDTPAVVVTWEKFVRAVLPSAERIEAQITSATRNFIALTGAEHADAPMILKWRNPVAWYVYPGGSPASQWGLAPGWAKLTGIVPLPTLWGDEPKPHLGEGVALVLDGCADSKTGSGNALFPECLIAELHPVRSTIEAFSRRAEMLGRDHASACGLDVRNGMKSIGYRLRVTACGLTTDYQIDRWD